MKNKILKTNTGFTLVDMIIAMMIAAVVVLTAGTISSISVRSHTKNFEEGQIYTEISYGFKQMQKYIRERGAIIDTPGGSWVGERFVINTENILVNQAFGLYQNGSNVELVYVPDITDETTRDVIFSTPASGNVSLDLTKSTDEYTVQISGDKSGIPYDLIMTVTGRT